MILPSSIRVGGVVLHLAEDRGEVRLRAGVAAQQQPVTELDLARLSEWAEQAEAAVRELRLAREAKS